MRRMLAALAIASLVTAQSSDQATINRLGDMSILSVHTFRPLDAVATTLESQFGIPVGAEDPSFQFRGDMMDISSENRTIRAGTLVPSRWGFEVRFRVNNDGSPQNVRDLLRSVVTAANTASHFAYRLDDEGDAFSFVPTRTRDAQGRSVPATPLLDRPVTIPLGIRRLNESASLMAKDLSRQTGLLVSCCQSTLGGYPWGMEEMPFAANGDSARAVLKRLGLSHWHVRCDARFCFIDLK